MGVDSKLMQVEDSLKEKHLSILSKLDIAELKKFDKQEYKKSVMTEMGTLLPDYQKQQYDQTAQCIVNFLQNEVKTLVRKQTSPSPLQGSSSNLLSETVLHDLDSTFHPRVEATDTESEMGDQLDVDENINCGDESVVEISTDNNQNMNDSVTILKEVANATSKQPTSKEKSTTAISSKNAKCCDGCKVKPTAKRKYDQIQCTFCMVWYHETCVGIKKDDPIGIWVCPKCRKVPSDLQNDIHCLKNEVGEIKKCTQSVLKAIEGLSTNFANTIGSLKDQMTSMSRQINSKELCISESIDNLQTTTNSLKTSMDQKTCQLINKTTAVFDKVKTHADQFKAFTNNSPGSVDIEPNEASTQSKVSSDKTNKPNGETNAGKLQKPSNKQRLTKSRAKAEQQRQRQHTAERTETQHVRDDSIIDLVEKKHIQQSTLLVGSSILKGVKNNELKPNTTVRSFSGATTVTLKDKLRAYNLDKCKTIIVHVGGNDADDDKDLESFCDDYISLLESITCEDRRIIVSGLLPRKGIDLEPYNEQLKALCDENNIEFINNFNCFLFASGELPATYFNPDKLHLNTNGTRKLLSNVDKMCKVTRPVSQGQTIPGRRMSQFSGVGRGPQMGWRPRSNAKYCHICSRGGHSTQECYFNGRVTETSRVSSR